MATIPRKVVTRLQQNVQKYQAILRTALDKDVNESDTVAIIADMLSDIFGYDKYAEITREYAIKRTFCDLAVKTDETIQFLIEVKAIGSALKQDHVRQATNYGADHGIPWVILTNGKQWHGYRITVAGKVNSERVFDFDFTELNTKKQATLDVLFLLCKQGLAKNVMTDYYLRSQAVNKYTIVALLLHDDIIKTCRSKVAKLKSGLRVSAEEIREIIEQDIVKRDLMSSEERVAATKKVNQALKPKKAKQ